jgi:hypothetical protein
MRTVPRIALYEGDMKLSSTSFAALAPAAQPRSTGTGSTATAAASKADEIAARKLQEAKNAVAVLATVKGKSNDAEKARAAQKVKELKARLQALKMLYAGDPKKLARAAAQIARELGAAVKSYTSAGGDAGDLAGTDASAPAGSEGAVADKGAEGSESGPASAEGAETPAHEAAEEDKADAKPDSAAPGLAKADDGKSAAQSARDKADDEFKNEARALARELKAALRRGHAKGPDEDDRRSAEQALATVDQTLGALPIADMGMAAVAGV